MRSFVIFLIAVAVINTSGITPVDSNQHEDLLNYQMDETDSKSNRKVRRSTTQNDDEMQAEERAAAENVNLKQPVNHSGIDLPPGYSIYKLPRLDENPMPIFVNINISKILDWDELNENIKLDMRLKVMWTDFKILQFNNSTHPGNNIPLIDTLSREEIKKKRKTINNPDVMSTIWKPNLFIDGLLAVTQPILMAKPIAVRFIPDIGWIDYTSRLQVKLDCSMNFQYYPADTQSCSFSIRAYSFTKPDLNVTWYRSGVFLNELELSNYLVRVDELAHYDLAKSYDPDEVFDVLAFKIFARRKLSYHLIQTYLASSFYIIITTLCFLLPSTMVEARIGISMTTLLTLTSMFGAVRESTPIVSYTKAIDIWMVGCIFFVFLTLLQFTFHTWLKHVKNLNPKCQNGKSKGIKNVAYEMDDPSKRSESVDDEESDYIEPSFSPKTIKVLKKLSHFLENYSFVLFLSIFFVFTIGYWLWLLSASNYFNWNVNPKWNRM